MNDIEPTRPGPVPAAPEATGTSVAELVSEFAKLRAALDQTIKQQHGMPLLARNGRLTGRLMEFMNKLKALQHTGSPVSAVELSPQAKPQPAKPTFVAKRTYDADALYRDFVIYKYSDLSNERLCQRLDFELMRRGDVPVGFPKRWNKKCGVQTYLDAYKNSKCRNPVQKLIRKAKLRFAGLP